MGAGGKEVLLTFLVGNRDTKGSSSALAGALGNMSLTGPKGKGTAHSKGNKEGHKEKKRLHGDSKGNKDSNAESKFLKKNAQHQNCTHPKFAPNPANRDCDLVRVPGTVVTTRVRVMHSELDARYRDLIQTRNSRVGELSFGKVGYLHVPDMERFGYSEFWRRFPGESKKGALVLDLRGNGGGHISELILQKLTQKPLALDVPRRGAPVRAGAFPNPDTPFQAPFVTIYCLRNTSQVHCYLRFMEYSRKATPLLYTIPDIQRARISRPTDLFRVPKSGHLPRTRAERPDCYDR